MPNAYMPRELVHERSEAIGAEALETQAVLQRLLRQQRRLIKFLEENQSQMTPASAGVSVYLTGVIIRLFDLSGGRLRGATWAQIRGIAARVQGAVSELLPFDGFKDRLRALDWRAQPHILDEAIMALFEANKKDEDEELSDEESFKIFCLLWVAVEVLDSNWKPPTSFVGESEYSYVHIEVDDADDEADAEAAGADTAADVDDGAD